ncbi:hypothetical protein ANO11243_093420 [Dothideomycetidae sp. 11243]|nr:hypothetical protein ANO11243_093420 [fungal sp. No.11243]
MRCSRYACILLAVCQLATPVMSRDNFLPNITRLPDRYIITLRPSRDLNEHLKHVKSWPSVAKQELDNYKGVTHQYNISDFQAYAGHFSPATMEQLRRHADVQVIEPDRVITVPESDLEEEQDVGSCSSRRRSIIKQCFAGWALHHISHKKKGINTNSYLYDSSAGVGTYAYVIDSGININHVEFQGRATRGFNAVPDHGDADALGHGTRVAGLIGSKTYGVAKRTNLIAVKVVENHGSTSTALLLAGYDWAVADINRRNRHAKAVINISITGMEREEALDRAVNAAFRVGVTTVASAGNYGGLDAGQFSPGGAAGSITVSAVDVNYRRWQAANVGSAVAIFAPGVGVKSTGAWSNTAVTTSSGTSLAAGVVSGLVVYAKGLYSLPDAAMTRSYILRTAVQGLVDNPAGAQNLFAYNGNGA